MIPFALRALALLRYLVLFAAADHVIAIEAPQVHDERAASAIAYVAATASPLFDDDADGTRTLAVLLATAREESSFDVDAIGDHRQAFGLNEIWKRPDLMAPIPNTIEALRQLRISFAECSRAPFSMYLSGKCQTSGRVFRQSERRMRRVASVLAIINGLDTSAAIAREGR